MLAYYEEIVQRAMGRLAWATPECAYAADINDLLTGLHQYGEARHELLTSIFGESSTPETRPLLSPEQFDAIFSKTDDVGHA